MNTQNLTPCQISQKCVFPPHFSMEEFSKNTNLRKDFKYISVDQTGGGGRYSFFSLADWGSGY